MSLLHEEDEARDVVHEVFLKLWESDETIGNPTAFILRAVRNACLSRLRSLDTREKIHRRLSLEPPPDDFDPGQHSEEISAAISLPSEEMTMLSGQWRPKRRVFPPRLSIPWFLHG